MKPARASPQAGSAAPHRGVASAAEIAALHAALRAVVPLSDDDLAALPPPARLNLLPGESFLQAGQRASEVGAVLHGALREYFVLEDGTERTKGFNLPGDFAGSLSDLLLDGPARTFVVAQANTVVLVTPWPSYRALVDRRPAWARFAREVAERLYRAKVQREYELLALDAAARYKLALERWPLIESIFTQRDIASYIGVTPVHLCRLRAAAGTTRPSGRSRRAR